MSSPQPQKLLVAPTPRVTLLADPTGEAPRGRIGFHDLAASLAAAQPQLRSGRHDPATETLAYYTSLGGGGGGGGGGGVRSTSGGEANGGPAANGNAKVRRGSHSPSITDHHIWTIGTSKRRTKSALRSSAALSRQQLELHHEVFAGGAGSLPGTAVTAANGSGGMGLLSTSTSLAAGVSGSPSAAAVPVVDQGIHYGVAGYRSENSGSVSFYRTSVHRKDPQNVVLSHGVVVHPRTVAPSDGSWAASAPGSSPTPRAALGYSAASAVPTTSAHQQPAQHHHHRRTSSSSLLESDTSSQLFPHVNSAANPHAPGLHVSRQGAGGHHNDDQTSLDGADRAASVAPPLSSNPDDLHSRREHTAPGSAARTASPPRPRWNTSARVAASAGTSPPASSAQGAATVTPRGSPATTTRSPPPPTAHGYGAATPLRSALVGSSSRTPRASSVGSHPPSLSGAGAPSASHRCHPHHHAHWPSQQHLGQTQQQLSVGSVPQVAGPHVHNCRDSHCLHSRADIMEVISAKSQVRAMESQLLHEEIRREQLASALSAERERSQQLSSALSRAEASVHASQEAIHDADALRDRCERLADELSAVTRERNEIRIELRRECELRLSLSNVVSEHEATIAQLRETVRTLERQQRTSPTSSTTPPPQAPPATYPSSLPIGSELSPMPSHEEFKYRPMTGNIATATATTATAFSGGPSGPAAAAMRAFTFPPPLVEEPTAATALKRFSPVVAAPPALESEAKTETTARGTVVGIDDHANGATAAAARLHALEAEVARLKEDRTADERLRRELLRALADKEKQMAAMSSGTSRSGSLRGSIVGAAAAAGLASPSSFRDATAAGYDPVDVSALSAPSPPDRTSATAMPSRRSSSRRILLAEPSAAEWGSAGGHQQQPQQRHSTSELPSTIIDSRHSRVLQVAQSLTHSTASIVALPGRRESGVDGLPMDVSSSRNLASAQEPSQWQQPPLPAETVPPPSALRSVDVTISSVNHSIDSDADGGNSAASATVTAGDGAPRLSVEHRLFPPSTISTASNVPDAR